VNRCRLPKTVSFVEGTDATRMPHGKRRTQLLEQKKKVEMKTYHEIFITSTTNTFNDIKMVPIAVFIVSEQEWYQSTPQTKRSSSAEK
jgi:hypothetical protein